MGVKQGLKLGHIMSGVGHGWGAWRHPGAHVDAGTNIERFAEKAIAAERGLFDFVFIADGVSTNADVMPQFLTHLEPLTLLSALAMRTKHIGLIGTFTVSYSEPYNLARQLASLDKISNGRAGWNVVTTPSEAAAANFGRDEHYDHDERYRRAAEFVDIVQGLWDSFEPGAIVGDKASGLFLDKSKLHSLDHKGEFFSVRGPLNIDRTPQGQPVIFQAGVSEAGRGFAARYAEAMFITPKDAQTARAFTSEAKLRASAAGRDPDKVFVFPAMSTVVGSTSSEARRISEERSELASLENRLNAFGRWFDGHDFSSDPLDETVRLPALKKPLNGFQGKMLEILEALAAEPLTLRQAATRFGAPTDSFDGTPDQVADQIQQWFESGAGDGFMIAESLPGQLDIFVDEVVPLLQQRGLYRSAYEGTTLRASLGLDTPANRYNPA